MNSNGVIYMNTWEQVRSCIRGIKRITKIREEIVSCKISRPEKMSVWIDRGDNQENGHAGK